VHLILAPDRRPRINLSSQSGVWRKAFQGDICEELNAMNTILKSMLLASCLAALSIPLRAQSVQDDAGTVSTDLERGGGATRPNEVKEPAGEPKGTNATGAETATEETVDPSDAKKDSKSSAAEEKSSGNASQE
jgi:hypothetical protein